MTELHELSAVEQAEAVRRGETSPSDLVAHYLERIDRLGPAVGAYVTVTGDLAFEQARQAERTLSQAGERDPAGTLPPLFGVPVAIKDLTLVRGVRATLGSAVFAEMVAPVDDHVVTLLREAGTLCLGKTNTPEFGLPCYTEPDVAPPARSPWDTRMSAGGSSGGAGAAVAAGLAPVAQGNDGGGSVRIPASMCGLVGLKVTRGRVSNGPLGADTTGLAWHGPLARTVADAAALLDAMAVPMPGDPHWAEPLPTGETFLGHVRAEPGRRLRIGRYRTPVIAETELHPECVTAYEQASRQLAGLGHDVEDIDCPLDSAVVPVFETLWSVGSTLAPVPAEREHELRPLTRWLRGRGRAVSGSEYLAAYASAQSLARQAVTATWPYDAVLTPTLSAPPFPVGALRDDDDPAGDFDAQKRFTPFTSAANLTGAPSVTLPLHWTPDGLPVGVMLTGRPAGEGPLLALAAQLEATGPAGWWQDRRPPVW